MDKNQLISLLEQVQREISRRKRLWGSFASPL